MDNFPLIISIKKKYIKEKGKEQMCCFLLLPPLLFLPFLNKILILKKTQYLFSRIQEKEGSFHIQKKRDNATSKNETKFDSSETVFFSFFEESNNFFLHFLISAIYLIRICRSLKIQLYSSTRLNDTFLLVF